MSPVQRAPHIESLFPPGVIAFEARGGSVPADSLFPIERDYVTRAIEKRVLEFAAGRACARAAMRELGLEAVAIPAGEDRAPVWPVGVVGSITHTDAYCLAVVADASRFASIGVDVEAAGRLKADLWRLTLHEDERAVVDSMEEGAGRSRATLLFSAKESFYKCQYALTRSWVGFEDVVVGVGEGTFEVTLINEARQAFALQRVWRGRFLSDEVQVVTAVALTR